MCTLGEHYPDPMQIPLYFVIFREKIRHMKGKTHTLHTIDSGEGRNFQLRINFYSHFEILFTSGIKN